MDDKDKELLRAQSRAMNQWAQQFFGKPRKKREKLCVICGEMIKRNGPQYCFKCFTNRDEHGKIKGL